MRTLLSIFLATIATHAADNLPVARLAGASFKVADLAKAKQFYTGMMGLDEAFDLRDSSGAVTSIFFKVNDEQYLEFAPGVPDGFHLEHLSLLAPDLKKMGAALKDRGITPGRVEKSADGNLYFAVNDPDRNELDFVQYMPGSKQSENRGKALGARRVSAQLQHIGLPADRSDDFMTFYNGKLGFRELFRGGPNDEIRWINLAVAGTPDILELMIMTSQPPQGRRHIAFEVPNMERAYKVLLARGLGPNSKPNEGPKQNHRWILNLRDPNGLRVEIMGELVAAK